MTSEEVIALVVDTLDEECVPYVLTGSLASRSVWFASPEDVIITKLNWYQRARRSKDIDDVRGVIAVQGAAALDFNYLQSWCDRHGTRELLEELITELDQRSAE